MNLTSEDKFRINFVLCRIFDNPMNYYEICMELKKEGAIVDFKGESFPDFDGVELVFKLVNGTMVTQHVYWRPKDDKFNERPDNEADLPRNCYKLDR